MFNFFKTLCNAAEHTTIKKTFGSYKNAALVEGNLNLFHKLQDEKLCNSRFIEPEDDVLLTLDELLGGGSKKAPKPEPEPEPDMKETFIKWFKGLGDEDKQFIKDALK